MLWLRDRRTLILAAVLAAGIGGAAYVWWAHRVLPTRDSALYREYQRTFEIGVAALEAGRADIAREQLDRAIELIPGEPAAWADRGLLKLRNNELTEAAADLKHASDLAPESGAIASLLGVLAEQQGRFPDAIVSLSRAVDKNPRDVRSLFLLAEVISKERGPDADVRYQRLMEQILKVLPNNLLALLERARVAQRSKDQGALEDTLQRFRRLAPAWFPEAKTALAELTKAKPGDFLPAWLELKNVLAKERSFSRDSRSLRPRPDAVGSPVQAFLRLEPMRSTPAPPDLALAFAVEPIIVQGKGASRWDVLQPVWLISEKQRNALIPAALDGGLDASPNDVFTPAVFVANATEVRRTDSDATVLPFPSGPKKAAPTYASLLAVDWNSDLRIDLILAGAGGLRWWKQEPDAVFTDVTAQSGLPLEIRNGDYFGVWAADIEMDGDLDLIAARRTGAPLVLRNNGDGAFLPTEGFAGVKDVRAFVWADLDNDGAPDAAFLDAAGKLFVFANERSGQFNAWQAPNDLGAWIALTAVAAQHDGGFNLVGVRRDGAIVRIHAQENGQPWRLSELARSAARANAEPGAAALLTADFDNNGALDLIFAGPAASDVRLGKADQTFAAVPSAVPLRVAAVLDVDRDGRLDVLGLTADGQPMRALNRSKNAYHWQTVWPLANTGPNAGDNRINSFAIGGEVEIRAGQIVQKQSIRSPAVHFGLGEQPAADIVRIVWPNGVPQWEFPQHQKEIRADRAIVAAQRLSGSCPYLFTFDGTAMRFAGDFMWGTPLGMFVNGQNSRTFPQTTEWLKIPGEHLAAKDGAYEVRVHANLWEVDYFDLLALLVVDHPADTEIHVDERFFLQPTKPIMRVTTLAKPIAHAWDHHGKDATAEVRAMDSRYLDRAGRGRFQGVAKDHWVEVELGDDAPRTGPVLLVARGWLQPTNSSINVALGQGKHEPPRPLALEVPDGSGGWKVAAPALGFPAGKNKTMLLRLDGINGPGVCRRFRLRTNMEIYWDFLGVATELDPKLARIQRPPVLSADLQFRGILQTTRKDRSSPEMPHYDKIVRGPQAWRDLPGYYTRFGAVGELLEKVDDRYVIMNAGDEIRLRFLALALPAEALPAGLIWKRDFIWECDGWTRDGDFNTRFGNGVLPLPAHGVKTEDRVPTRLQDDLVFQRFPHDWQRFHTRFVTPDEFRLGLRIPK